MEKLLFTSESVTEGHPDKVCDAISDAILDALMEQDPNSRVACESVACTGYVLVTGEITTKAYVDIPKIVRETVKEIGYDRGKYGFDADNLAVLSTIDEQFTKTQSFFRQKSFTITTESTSSSSFGHMIAFPP